MNPFLDESEIGNGWEETGQRLLGEESSGIHRRSQTEPAMPRTRWSCPNPPFEEKDHSSSPEALSLSHFITPLKFAKPHLSAFNSTGFVSKKQKQYSSGVFPTPQTPSKRKPTKFIPLTNTPFALRKADSTKGLVSLSTISTKKPVLKNKNTLLLTSSPQSPSHHDSSSPIQSRTTTDHSSSPFSAKAKNLFGNEDSVEDSEDELMELDSFSVQYYNFPQWRSSTPRILDNNHFLQKYFEPPNITFSSSPERECADFFQENFAIVSLIGHGSFADVYKVLSKHDGSIYAVKKNRMPYTGVIDRARKLIEVENLWKVSCHPHCLRIYQAWEQNGYLHIQTQYCDSGSLKNTIEQISFSGDRLDEMQIWNILYQVSLGLGYIHSLNMIHLDIKPDNILIFEGCVLKIADFGLSRMSGQPLDPDTEGDKYYMAPELLDGLQGKPADIFSLGMILLELAANIELPSQGDMWQNLRKGIFSDLSFEGISTELINMILSMLHPEPLKRPEIQHILEITNNFISQHMSPKELPI